MDEEGSDVMLSMVDEVPAGAEEEGDSFFLVCLGAGRRGQEHESCPACLHRGQAFSEPGHEAMTLNPSRSKSGVAERGLPSSGIFNTMS